MFQKLVKVLLTCPLFQDIKEEQLNIMLECLKPKICNYKKDQFITFEGEKFDGIGIVISGNSAITKETMAGNRIIISIIEPGSIFGEIVAFSKKDVWPATLVALKDCKVMFLPSEKIVGECENLCSCHRTLIMNMLKIISDKALVLNRKVDYLALKSIREKISTYLLEQYKKTGSQTFTLQLNRNELADFLNVSRPPLSREMCKMRDEGIIDFDRSTIQILDLDKLRDFVG
jgi:CRP-like cAMP-binding protein